jgi:hypothetical protein
MQYLDHIYVTVDSEIEPVLGHVHSSIKAANAAIADGAIIYTLFDFINKFPRHIFAL